MEIDKSRYFKMRKFNSSKEVAGRTYKEILDRFDMKIKDPRRSSSGKINTRIIKEFLKIKCELKSAPYVLNKFFQKYELNIFVGKEFFPFNKINNSNLKIEFSIFGILLFTSFIISGKLPSSCLNCIRN